MKYIITNDHRIVRDALRTHFAKTHDMECVGEAENGQQLLDMLQEEQPDMVILNVSMPVMNGLETMPVLRLKYPALKVVVLSMQSDPKIIRTMIESGANAYLTLDCGFEELDRAIYYCRHNWLYINDTVRNALIQDCPGNIINEPVIFTEREIQLLKLLYKNYDLIEIAGITELSTNTIVALIGRMKKKAGLSTIKELCQLAVERGVIS